MPGLGLVVLSDTNVRETGLRSERKEFRVFEMEKYGKMFGLSLPLLKRTSKLLLLVSV
jgi:hypothetical protein